MTGSSIFPAAKARVDLYFLKRGGTTWTTIGSTTASSRGTFQRTVTATATGTYRAVYRGNAHRRTAERRTAVSVYTPTTTTRTLYAGSGFTPSCGRDWAPCMYTSPLTTTADAPLHGTVTVTAKYPGSVGGMTIWFTDPGFLTTPYELTLDEIVDISDNFVDLTAKTATMNFTMDPKRTTGKFFIRATGDYAWTMKITQTVTENRPV